MSLITQYFPLEDEEKKKKKPSQIAGEQQKAKSSLIRQYFPAKEIPKPVIEKKPTFIEKAKGFLQKAKKVLFTGKEVKKDEQGKPIVSLTEAAEQFDRPTQVGLAEQRKQETIKLLEEAEKEKANIKPFTQVDPMVDKRISGLKQAIRDYDEFLGNEQSDQGVVKEFWSAFKKTGMLPDYYVAQYDNELNQAVEKSKRGEELTKHEQMYLNQWRASSYQNMIKKGISEEVAAGLAIMPKYGFDIALYGSGVRPATSSLAAQVMNLPGRVLSTLAPKIIKNSVNLAIASQLNIPSLSEKAAEYMTPIPDYEKALSAGKDVDILSYIKSGDTPEQAKRKASLINMIEYISEGVGGYIDDAMPFVKKLFVAKWLKNKNISPTTNPNIIKKLLGAIRFDGIVNEVIEEEIGEPFTAKVEERKYYDPFTTPEGRERLLVEVLIIGAFAGMAKVSDKTLQVITGRRKKTGNEIKIEVEEKPLPPIKEEPLPGKPVVSPPLPGKPVTPIEVKPTQPIVGESGGVSPLATEAKGVSKKVNLKSNKTPEVRTFDNGGLLLGSELKGGEKVTIKTSDGGGDIVGKVVRVGNRESSIKAIEGGGVAEGSNVKQRADLNLKWVEVLNDKGQTEWIRLRDIKEIQNNNFTLPTQAKGGVKPVEPKETSTDKFYINTLENGERKFVEAFKAKPVEIVPGVETFVSKDINGKNWIVSEARTGMSISDQFNTAQKAIDDAKKILSRNLEKTPSVIEQRVKDHGLSPRYKKVAEGGKIEPYEKPKVSRKGTERPGLPGAVSKGKEPPGRVEEAITKPSEPAGGKPDERHAKPGKRPPARITPADQVKLNKQIEELVARKGSGYLEKPGLYSDEEKELLKQYTGGGGLEKGGAEGRGLLDEYYTPIPVVNFMWDRVKGIFDKRQGYRGVIDRMLEPAVGIGRFLENSPHPNGLGVKAFEVNKTSAIITKVLYPEADVENSSFETIFIDDRGNKKEELPNSLHFEVVIGNPPYGEHRGRYLGLGEEPKIPKYEEYFLKRGIDLLKDNGILAYVMPSGFLRGSTNYAKQEISKVANLVEAYRLPNGVFGTTDIGTDILIFQKGKPTLAGLLSDDNYFVNYPKRILGTVEKGMGNYGADLVKGTLDEAMRLAGRKEEAKPPTIQTELEKTPEDIAPEERDLDEGRVKAPHVITNKANKKAILVSKKKDTTIKLSDVEVQERDMWANVEATGEINIDYINRKYPDAKSLKDFNNKDIAVEPGNNNLFYPNVLYYQGNIYDKLDNLKARKDELNPEQYQRQKEGLEKVLPEPKAINAIQLKPNSSFARQITMNGRNLIDTFKTWIDGLPSEVFGDSSEWEVREYINGSVVNTGDKLRNIQIRKRRRDIGIRLFNRYLRVEIEPGDTKVIEDQYNRTFNSYYRPEYKKIPLLSEVNAHFKKDPLKMTPLQKEGAAFLASKGVGLLGYDVGLGKTMTAIVAVNEVMKRGWARKPLIVVPNAVYLQWVREIQDLIPGVKINSLANLGGRFKGDLKTLEIEDGTISLITYDGLTKLGFRMETYDELTDDLKDVMAGQTTSKRGKAKEGEAIEQVVGKAIRGTTGDRFFEDLGFDHLTIDEVQNFKNIFAGAKLEKRGGNEYRNVRGTSSMRGIKAYLMTQYVLKQNKGRNVFALSATPFTNSPMEIYSILSLMGKKRLEQIGLKNVNDFMSMFMDMKSTFVVKADQTVKEEDVIEGFSNLQQLQKIVTEFIDFRTGEEVGIERPGRTKRTIPLNPTATQVDYILKAQSLFQDKDKGGAIVAITELQNITLSPYLSRYNDQRPTYKTFVNNSPKIKYAIEAVAQVRKDNKDVGQIIYMPRGVEFFDFIKQYLIKEKGFRAGQIGIISGGMSVDAKYSVQNKFNSGEIKVLIGSESMKEGVNLQEKSTDLYHLHLPWNPTDMLQVEGRIWRQGNDYKNVRIHYPLIENSVDSFIFQKLETKEKRIKNLWSYKGDAISVGDLDFENMKLDLITDPVIRVKAEETFEKAKEERKLDTLKVEHGFASRKLGKLNELKENLSNYKGWKQDAIKDSDDSNVEYYTKQIKKTLKEISDMEASLKKQGVEVTELKSKAEKIEGEIKLQEKVIEDLTEKYEAKVKVAETERISLVSKPVDYKGLMSTIAQENKTFFVKRKILRGKYATAPSGTAFKGEFAELENITKKLSEFKIIPFPEMVRLAKELSKQILQVKALRGAVLGKFEGMAGITLDYSVFEKPLIAAKVLAHEIGHLFDWLPEGIMARGNLLGRLATLQKHLKWIYRDLDNKVVKKELQDLSMKWSPYDEAQVSTGYIKYRNSARELYADAISVLLNDPERLAQEAPEFYRGFTEYLDRKPEAREEYMKLNQLLERGSDELNKVRLEEMYKGFEEALKKRKDVFDQVVEKKSRSFKLATQHITKFYPIYDELKGMPEKQKVRETLEEMAMSRNDVWLDLDRNEKEVVDVIKQAGITENQLGAWFVLERNLSDRVGLANPDGLIGEFNQEVLDFMEKNFTPDQQTAIKTATTNFHKATFEIVDEMFKQGMIKPEVFKEKIEPFRNTYVTFGVVKYIDKNYVNPNIQRMRGTLSKIENPLITTMFKRASMLQAIALHKGKKSVVDILKTNFSDEIKESKSVMGIKHQKIYQKTFGKGQIGLFENGTWTAYDVDPYFEDMFNQFNPKDVHTLVDLANKFNRVFKPTVTTYKIGWALYNNPVRDVQRTMRNLAAIYKAEGKNYSRLGFLADWARTIPEGFRFAKGELTELGKEAIGAKAISTPWVSYDPTAGEDKALYSLYRKYNFLVGADPVTRSQKIRDKFIAPIKWLLGMIELAGATFESTTKLAGYRNLARQFENKGQIGFYNRTYLGTPNYLEGGTMKEIDNSLFVFSNIMLQGLRADAELIKNPKSRGAYFFEMFLQSGMWKVLMVAAAGGFLGSKLEDKFAKMTEYDKSNYITIPLCYSVNNKVAYWRIPQDEINRLAGAIIWKTGMALQGKAVKPEQILNIGAGYLPSITPLFEIVGAWFDYIEGKNPYDSFYGRSVLDYQTEKIRGWEGTKKMFYWTLNKIGLGNFTTYDVATKTTIEKIIQFAPILNRALRITDYGLTEQEKEVEKAETREGAIESKKEKDAIVDAVEKYIKEGGDPLDYKFDLIESLGIEDKAEKTRLKNTFDKEVLKREGDSRTRTIINLRLNTTKIKTLKKYKEEMATEEFEIFLDKLEDNKVISKDVYKEVMNYELVD